MHRAQPKRMPPTQLLLWFWWQVTLKWQKYSIPTFELHVVRSKDEVICRVTDIKQCLLTSIFQKGKLCSSPCLIAYKSIVTSMVSRNSFSFSTEVLENHFFRRTSCNWRNSAMQSLRRGRQKLPNLNIGESLRGLTRIIRFFCSPQDIIIEFCSWVPQETACIQSPPLLAW